MTDYTLHERILDSKDWAIIVFVTALLLLAVAKSVFETRFVDFSRLAWSDKYIKIYRDNDLMGWFTIALFAVHLISAAFFIQLLLFHFGHAAKSDWILYIRIFTVVGVFILGKYLIEKIIATSFGIEEIIEQFNLYKLSYRTYIGMILLPANLILYFNDFISTTAVYVIIAVILLINILTYLNSLKIYQNLIVGKMFYFILYLCALEIAPYYLMYYWFTRS
jgi:hypothetical protein